MSRNAAHQLLTMSNNSIKQRKLSREEIINKMENEQDAIVIKLLREIDQLKRENNYLKSTVNYLSKKQNITNHHQFDTDDESAIIIDNINLNLYTPSHSRKSSVTSNNNNNNIYPVETRQRNVSISSASSNEHPPLNSTNRRRRRTSSSIYSNVR
ncbi:hypothetical protein MOUN0_K09164 [Monosporozyma unispora]|nr:hypothetical protein C6P44_002266 [Kazachstania unispora]